MGQCQGEVKALAGTACVARQAQRAAALRQTHSIEMDKRRSASREMSLAASDVTSFSSSSSSS